MGRRTCAVKSELRVTVEITLIEVITKYSALPFRWGSTDCCRFVGECIKHLRGTTPIGAFVYNDETTAQKLIDEYGSLRELFDAEFAPVDPAHVRDGDIALVEIRGEQIASVFWNKRVWAKTEKGVCSLPADDARGFWSP